MPAGLEAYLYDHATREQAEIYANYHLHSTTKLLLSEEAADIIHIKGINWNANLNNPLDGDTFAGDMLEWRSS